MKREERLEREKTNNTNKVVLLLTMLEFINTTTEVDSIIYIVVVI